MKIVKGTVDSRIVTLSRPDSVKYIQNRPTLGIIGGEFAITYDEDNMPIATLLGSCVAVMLYDSVFRIKGMNHFLLPTSCAQRQSCRFGLYAMEMMLNEMYKLGCRKENITAKIAGGANILHDLSDNIGERNVLFARSFCHSEGIRIVAENVLGTNGRVVMLDNGFKTISKIIANRLMEERLVQSDRALAKKVEKTEKLPTDDSGVTLF